MILKISDKVLPSFYDFWKKCNDNSILNIVAKGGRNSSKSTTISLWLIYNRMRVKSHAIAVRKIDKTLRRSCREQLIWAIKHLEVDKYWHWSDTPSGDMTLVYKPTGASIFFEGANNPEKIKSYKTSDMPITEVWVEELAEFKLEEEVSMITNSFLREQLPEGMHYKFFFSYNPPKRKQNWVNKKYETVTLPKHTYVHHSDYKSNPFVSDFFIEEADHVEKTNKRKYDWEYLGKPIGSGVVPFDNLQFRIITDKEYNTFDNLRQGQDWGYATDAAAWVRWHYDKTRKTIYAMSEVYGVKLSNEDLARGIGHLNGQHVETICDSASPKDRDRLKELGCNFKSARKGQGSVEYGEKWLDELEAIVIDPERTPNIAREFESIDYQTDKDGNARAKLEDKDNHTIDATRYAFEKDFKSRIGVINI